MGDKTAQRPITLDLILSKSSLSADKDNVEDCLLKLKRIWLDNSGITMIDNLEMLGNVTHLYLENNAISIIENLETLGTTLQHLSLKGNVIVDLGEGLICLDTLMSLDLSFNNIENISLKQLPKSLSFLNILENPACNSLDKDAIIEGLPRLKMLNNEMIQEDTSEDEEDENVENIEPENYCFQDVTRSLREDSKARQDLIDENHQNRITTLGLLKDEMSSNREESLRISQNTHFQERGTALVMQENNFKNSTSPIPQLERALSSQSIGRKSSLLEPIQKPPTPKISGSSKGQRKGSSSAQSKRVNSPKRIGTSEEKVDISLRQPLETALVSTDELDTYLTGVHGMFSEIRKNCQDL